MAFAGVERVAVYFSEPLYRRSFYFLLLIVNCSTLYIVKPVPAPLLYVACRILHGLCEFWRLTARSPIPIAPDRLSTRHSEHKMYS